ncbi:rhodanese-like domain-containing protein [Deinococcus kurensis]|uniref:rhodanese-like domain-containing protein n=1 Tax=Deinococcus kurensis TaxID=2662757 RepID=UPI0012D34396|nr:rhodanese-like domain-containing protein [Deinococcus kurensis]
MFGFLTRLLGSPVPGLTPRDAQALTRQGALILDVREHAERAQDFIPGSRHVPLGEVGHAPLPQGRVLICQCATGRRSALAARQLQARGFEVRNLQGGIRAWQAAGLPTRRGTQP